MVLWTAADELSCVVTHTDQGFQVRLQRRGQTLKMDHFVAADQANAASHEWFRQLNALAPEGTEDRLALPRSKVINGHLHL